MILDEYDEYDDDDRNNNNSSQIYIYLHAKLTAEWKITMLEQIKQKQMHKETNKLHKEGNLCNLNNNNSITKIEAVIKKREKIVCRRHLR
jgi:hypothetical protein